MSGLELRSVSHAFPGHEPVVDGLHLSVPAGGCVALLGESGSGKSTVLRLVAGLEPLRTGSVVVAGRDVGQVPAEQRRTALVFQRPRLFPHLDVRDNVAFPLVVAGTPRRRARERAEAYLDLIGTPHLSRRRPGTLSGGQEQRVALARALAAEPDVLLLDEPFSALDPSLRSEMHELLHQLRAAVEPTILLVTHDRHEAAAVADTVAVLRGGRIAQHDRVDVLHARPVDLDVHRFLGGLNAVPGEVADGVHASALGRLEVETDLPDGPGTLVVRHEAVSLIAPGRDSTVVGRVVACRSTGALARVRVDVDGVELVVDTPLPVAVGDRVGVLVPVAARHVVPGTPGGATSAGSQPTAVRTGAARPPAAGGA